MEDSKSNLSKPGKDLAVVERTGLLGQMTVQPIEVQGNEQEAPLGFVYEWAKFFSLPVGRMESVFNLSLWGFTGNLVGCMVHMVPWLLLPAFLVLGVMATVSYYTPELTPVILLRLAVVVIGVVVTMVVL